MRLHLIIWYVLDVPDSPCCKLVPVVMLAFLLMVRCLSLCHNLPQVPNRSPCAKEDACRCQGNCNKHHGIQAVHLLPACGIADCQAVRSGISCQGAE